MQILSNNLGVIQIHLNNVQNFIQLYNNLDFLTFCKFLLRHREFY